MSDEKNLNINPKHKAFADEYLNNGRNATKAYMTTYKPKTQRIAEVSGGRLLRNVAVQQYIVAYDAKNLKEKEISKNKYLKFLDSLVDDVGELKTLPEGAIILGEVKDRAIQAIKVIGKWQGYESPDKTQFLGKDGQPVDPNTITISKLTPEQRKFLIGKIKDDDAN